MESMDWNSCIICRESDGDLRCPVDSLQNNAFDVCNKFLEAVEEFCNLDTLPINVKFKNEKTSVNYFINTKPNGINHVICIKIDESKKREKV